MNSTMISRKAFITGGGTGIGKGIALWLAKCGYDVIISYYGSAAGAEDTVSCIEKLGRKAVAIRANVGKVEEIQRMFAEYRRHFSTLDLFVNNAGITKKASFLETDETLFDQICSVDYKGAFFCMQEAAKLMVECGTAGSIVLISSNNAVAHFADVAVYASVKQAATKMAEHAAIELAKYGIRVNTVAPGWTDTGATRLDDKASTYYKIPLQKWATVEEVAKTVEFLASDGAASITGSTIVVDNGALLVSDKLEKYGF